MSIPLPVVGTDVPDHVAAAVGRLCEQFKNKTNVTALVTALVGPVTALESALWQLLTQRQVSTAQGSQLDALGKLVNQPRNGASDTDYPRYIKAQIATSTSHGKSEDLIKIAKLVLNDTADKIILKNEGIATVVLQIANDITTDAVAAILIPFLQAAVSAGVRVILEYEASSPANTFTCDIGPGWDIGAFATALG